MAPCPAKVCVPVGRGPCPSLLRRDYQKTHVETIRRKHLATGSPYSRRNKRRNKMPEASGKRVPRIRVETSVETSVEKRVEKRVETTACQEKLLTAGLAAEQASRSFRNDSRNPCRNKPPEVGEQLAYGRIPRSGPQGLPGGSSDGGGSLSPHGGRSDRNRPGPDGDQARSP
jgi:hypothetical protein